MTETGTPKTTFIYALACPITGALRYIGKADDPSKRFCIHLSTPDTKDHRGAWIRSLLSQGLRPVMQVIYETPKDGWQAVERRFIHTARSLGFPLTNCTDGGEGKCGYVCSPGTRAKMSASRRKWRTPAEGIEKMRKANLGRKHSLATRAKMSAARSGVPGKIPSKESRARMSEAQRGRKHTVETIAKMRVRMLGEKNHNFGKKPSAETRAKISAAGRGREVTQATRDKQSAAQVGEKGHNFGKRASAATRAKMSAARSGEKNHNFGKVFSPETRAKIRAARARQVISPETCARISAGNIGKRRTAEARAKISAAAKIREARKREEKLQNGNHT